MTPQTRRLVVPIILLVISASVVAIVAINRAGGPAPTPTAEPSDQTDRTEPAGADDPTAEGDQQDRPAAKDAPGTTGDAAEPAESDADADAEADAGDSADAEPADADADDDQPVFEPVAEIDLTGLYAVAPTPVPDDADDPQPLGSVNPNQADLFVEFSRTGAGIKRITSANHWYNAAAKLRADAHYAALRNGTPPDQVPPLPDPEQRYVLTEAEILTNRSTDTDYEIPAFAANSIRINGTLVPVFSSIRGDALWTETAPGEFQTVIRNASDEPIVRISRSYALGSDGDIPLRQRIENLTDSPLEVQWIQYGPSELTKDRWSYIDMRRFRIGYQKYPQQYPTIIEGKDNDQIFQATSLLKDAAKARDVSGVERQKLLRIWPNEDSIDGGFALSWFASTNRYFAVAVHPLLNEDGTGELSLTRVVDEIQHQAQNPEDLEEGVVFTVLYSPTHTIEANTTLNLDMGVYAGPMSKQQLAANATFQALKLQSLILYQMSTMCAICTFQWLANVLLAILGAVHFVLMDWGIAIIILVIIVRTILHPLTKKAQINMQKFGKTMGVLKPEIDKIQKKYADDPKKLQQEQMKLWREYGVSPFSALGCLPMFLQMPIWVALYAGLYFAFELRQEPAFYGLFQLFGHWQFLADLAAPDRFIPLFDEPKKFKLLFLHFDVSSINILPLLMGAIFFVQQKYMSPPPGPNVSKEQQQQQKIMRVMMVVMMPVLLYSAPSGLILYILTSSTLGVLESRYIRAHVEQLDLEPKRGAQPGKKKKKKPRGPQARAYAEALERAKAKRQQKKTKNYKKRK